ncbi:tyrosine-type recombinase/integrase, partial [Candidatus Poribacteria bacterium]
FFPPLVNDVICRFSRPSVLEEVHIRKGYKQSRRHTKSMTPQNSKIDIHNYDRNYEQTRNHLKNVDMSDQNRQLILDFQRACLLRESLSKPRVIRIMQALSIIARRYIGCDFDKMDKRAVEEMVLKIESQKYSVWTKQSYKAIIKKFFKWIYHKDDYTTVQEYPPIVNWIRTNVKKKDRPRVKASDLLTEEEVRRMMNVAQHPRDKAFISMLYELGARIGEIGGLRVKDLARDEHSFIVDLSGKTGHRTPRIVISDPYLTAWLEVHPLRDDRYAPLWVLLGRNSKHMEYGTFRRVVQRIKYKAGVEKRLYHHLFRHTRATHLLMNKQINEAQAKVYFGWVPDSKMLSEYSHLMSSDVNRAILEIHGIKTKGVEKPLLEPKQCHRCSKINGVEARFCYHCGLILDVKTAVELDAKRSKGDNILDKLMEDPDIRKAIAKKMIDIGLKDEIVNLK